MKYLLVIAVVGVLLWAMFGRGGRARSVQRREDRRPADAPVAMLACAHCGMHLPKSDALLDAAGRPYCGEPHRLAGPRG
jgi:uncharacterized protein